MNHREDLEDLLAELAVQTKARHPSTEEWIAYSEGRSPLEERAWLELHLQGCTECCETLDELKAFPHRPGPDLSEREQGAAWQALRRRVDSGVFNRSPATAKRESASTRWSLGRSRLRWALAAFCVAFGLWGVFAQQRAKKVLDQGAGGDLALVTLVEMTNPLRGASDDLCVPSDQNAALALPLQHLAALGPEEPLVAEVLDQNGRVRLRREGLHRRTTDGPREIISLPASRLDSGPYTLRLSADGEAADTFSFEVCSL